MSVFPRRLVFEGRQPVAALLIDDTPRGRAKVLALWKPGVLVQRCAEGLVVRFPEPTWLDCGVADGRPLLARGAVLVGQPMTDQGLARLNAPAGSLVLARGGALTVLSPDAEEVDPSRWLDVDAFSMVALTPVTVRSAPPPTAVAPRPIELRPRADALPPDAARALVQALGDHQLVPQPPAWRRAGAAVLRWFRDRQRRADEAAAAGGTTTPGWWDRLNTWLSARLDATRVGAWMADVQRGYVDRLLKMFERDDLDEALRHAIPLSRTAADPDAPRSLAPMGPRSSLALNFGPVSPTGAGATLEPAAYETLRKRYRAAAKQLEDAGRIDEAAFVLADLLQAPNEAVALLERHGQVQKAAQLAEARGLSADAVVRLWVLANDLERAVLIARQRRAFSSAVALLEKGHLGHARTLRLLWAESLANTGDFAAAVKVASPIPEARALTLKWVDLGIDAGGVQAAPLLARRIELAPLEIEKPMRQALTLLRSDEPEEASQRAALGEAVVQGLAQQTAIKSTLARAAARALVRDEAALGLSAPGLLQKLLALDDGTLRADLPTVPPGVRPVDAAHTLSFPRDPTALTPFDAVLTPSGALLVALGENGLALVSSAGKVVWRSDVPAYSLAISHEGATVMAMVPREDLLQVSTVSLTTRTVTRWGDVPVVGASGTLRDGTWFAASDRLLFGLDVLAPAPSVLWKVPRREGRLLSLNADERNVVALIDGGPGAVVRQAWHLPDLGEGQRQELPVPAEVIAGHSATMGHSCIIGRDAAGSFRAWSNMPDRPALTQVDLRGGFAGAPAVGAAIALPNSRPGMVEVHVMPLGQHLWFESATKVTMRFQGAVLVVAADNGRVVCVDTVTHRATRNLCVRLGA